MYDDRRHERLEFEEVLQILTNPCEAKMIDKPPVNPRPGDLYLYRGTEHTINDWKCDRLCWVNDGNKKLPRKNPIIRKSYFNAKVVGENNTVMTSKSFKREASSLIDNPHHTLIQYMGTPPQNSNVPHGNSKDTRKSYVRTAPSVLKQMDALGRTAAATNQATNAIYRQMVTAQGAAKHQGVLNPRNSKQIENRRSAIKQRSRLSHDSIYALHEIAYHLPEFVQKIETFPDLVCVMGNADLLSDMNELLKYKEQGCTAMSYDTTFNLGDFYKKTFIKNRNPKK